jgi:HlyD family secretion protein
MSKRVVIGVLAAAVLLGAAAWASLRSRVGTSGAPVFTVKRGPFVRRVRAEGNFKAVNAKPITAPGNDIMFKIGWMAEDGSRVKSGDIVVRFDPTETQKNLTLGQADRSTAERRMDKERAEAGATLSNLGRDARQARLEVDTARTFQKKDPELFSRHEIIEADIDVDLAEHREVHATSTRGVKEGLSKASLDIFGIDRKKADLKIGKAEKELAALEVRSPFDGLIVFQRDWKGDLPQIGQVVWSGLTLAEIPDLSTLQADIWVLEADAGGLATGREATVVVEAHPEVEYAAKIKKIDALAKPRVRGVPVQYFGVTLELAKTDPAVMKPGQRVLATLLLGEESDVLSIPRQALFERDGKKVVFRRDRGGFTPVPVTLGASAVGRVVVTAGLADGDVIALADPEKAAAPVPGTKGGGPGAAP